MLVLLEQNRGGEGLFLQHSVVELLFPGGSDPTPAAAGVGYGRRVWEALNGLFL